jgi:hypothetical protein
MTRGGTANDSSTTAEVEMGLGWAPSLLTFWSQITCEVEVCSNEQILCKVRNTRTLHLEGIRRALSGQCLFCLDVRPASTRVPVKERRTKISCLAATES